jgi:hypothetical protein
MFLSAYVALVFLAALPLARTLLTGRGGRSGVIFLHRLYRDLAYIAAAVVAIIGFEMALTISLQNYWFSELGQRYRYWLALGIRTGIFLALLISVGAFIGTNLRNLCRPLPAAPRSAPWFAGFVLAALVGIGATTPLDTTPRLPRGDYHRRQRSSLRQRHFLLPARLALVRLFGCHRHHRARHDDCALGADWARVLSEFGKALASAGLPPRMGHSSITARH